MIPSDIDHERGRRLDHLQGVINRLAGNSFSIKGWVITLVTAMLGFALKDNRSVPEIAYLAVLPTIVFWILDGYYLAAERSVRYLYNSVASSTKCHDMGISVPPVPLGAIAAAAVRPTTLLLYVSLLTCEVLVGLGVFGGAVRLLKL
jgi:hypothetical protein